jgi:hypothetical protein
MLPRAAQHSGWTSEEREHLGRLEARCNATQYWTLEWTTTDGGYPWCLIRDERRRVVVLHFLRIHGRYVAVWPEEHRSANMASIDGAIDRVLREIASQAA